MSLAKPPPQAMVIFGASGDLTSRKIMPALFNLFLRNMLPNGFYVVGYSRSQMTDDEFRARMREAVETNSRTHCDAGAWQQFSSMLHYTSGEFESEGAFRALSDRLNHFDEAFGTKGRRLFYCATPPVAFPQIAIRVGEEGIAGNSRIVVEKPFGEDLESAVDLNAVLHDVFDEEQVFRIDHYLGKETVQNILVFRFSNGMFEPIWNRRYIKAVEITVAEEIGIEGRGKFYDRAGAIRDVLQNHLMQLLSILAMEPPAAFDAESIRDEKVKVLRAVPPADPARLVRGQYGKGQVGETDVAGYCDEPDVAADSKTETFVALQLEVANWRWAGVPFYLRTGKRLARRATEVTIDFRDAPYMLFANAGLETPEPNHLTIRIQPNEGISLTFDAKAPGPEMQVSSVKMDFDYEESFQMTPAEAYERLLHEAMEGDRTLFTRGDEVERAWEVLEPVLDLGSEPETYPAGSWGPKSADDLIAPGKWHLR